VLAIEDDDCHHCGERRHHVRNCPKKEADERGDSHKDPERSENAAAAKAAKKAKWKLKCKHCGKKGHTEEECWSKKKELEKTMAVDDPPTSATRTNLQNQQSALAAYLSSLKEGNAPAQRMVTVANEHSHNERTQHDVDDDALLSSARTLSQATSRSRCQATNDISRGTAYGYRGDAHIGEASHPGPASYSADMNTHVRKHSVLQALFVAMAYVR
jgi:hypothetical protein